MTVGELVGYVRPAVTSGEAPRCSRCSGTDHLITGDGPVVCGACLLAFGQAAASEPDELAESFVKALLERHGDVVKRVWVASSWVGGMQVVKAHSEWRWTSSWPAK